MTLLVQYKEATLVVITTSEETLANLTENELAGLKLFWANHYGVHHSEIKIKLQA